MGKVLFSSTRSNATVELLREWVGNFLQAMEDAGFVRTDDLNQVNPETVELVNSASITQYALYRFDDSLQGSHPLFFKVGFGTGTSSTGNTGYPHIGLTISVGKGTDGQGNLTQIVLPEVGCGGSQLAGNYGPQDAREHIAVSGDGYIALWGFVTSTDNNANFNPANRFGFLIERSRDTQGLPTGDGIMVVASPSEQTNPAIAGVRFLTGSNAVIGSDGAGQTEMQCYAINYSTGAFNRGSSPIVTFGDVNGVALSSSSSLASGSIGPVFPWDMVAPGLAPWRSCALVSIPAGDMPRAVFETNLCGQTVKFHPVFPSYLNSRWGIAFGSSGVSRWFGAGIRWED